MIRPSVLTLRDRLLATKLHRKALFWHFCINRLPACNDNEFVSGGVA